MDIGVKMLVKESLHSKEILEKIFVLFSFCCGRNKLRPWHISGWQLLLPEETICQSGGNLGQNLKCRTKHLNSYKVHFNISINVRKKIILEFKSVQNYVWLVLYVPCFLKLSNMLPPACCYAGVPIIYIVTAWPWGSVHYAQPAEPFRSG